MASRRKVSWDIEAPRGFADGFSALEQLWGQCRVFRHQFGCTLVRLLFGQSGYVLVRVAQIRRGESKIPLVCALDLGSGGAILRGSSPLLGMSFIGNHLDCK